MPAGRTLDSNGGRATTAYRPQNVYNRNVRGIGQNVCTAGACCPAPRRATGTYTCSTKNTAQTEHDGAKRAKLRNIMRRIARVAPHGLTHKAKSPVVPATTPEQQASHYPNQRRLATFSGEYHLGTLAGRTSAETFYRNAKGRPPRKTPSLSTAHTVRHTQATRLERRSDTPTVDSPTPRAQ